MHCITIFLITIFIPSVYSARPKLRLTFIPDEKYMTLNEQVEIKCDWDNTSHTEDAAQLWYINLATGERLLVSRKSLPNIEHKTPEALQENGYKSVRYSFVSKNHYRIQHLQMEDSAQFECECPDCEEPITPLSRTLYVMKLATPTWIIEQGWPLHENTKTIIKCQVENFYPYVTHKILRNHADITHLGSSSLLNKTLPQQFTWEATVTPKAEWHDSTLECIVTQGKVDEQTSKLLSVLFAPRFNKCDENQYVDAKKNVSTIECSYSGNPQPTLLWLRQSDKKSIERDVGITIQARNETNGKYRSVVTFDQHKLTNISSIPKANGQGNKTESNYFEQLLNDGFIAQLTVNGNDKGRRIIKIVRDASQMRSIISNKSTIISYSSILSLSFLFILYMIQR